MSSKKRRTIDLWVVLHTPNELKNRQKEITLSVHSQLIIEESRPTKLAGTHTLHLQGTEEVFLVHLDTDEDTPLFIHVMAVVDSADSLAEEHSIGYRNIRLDPTYRGSELLVDIGDFQSYRLCRPGLELGYSI